MDRLTGLYFRPKRWESTRLYEWLGVRAYKRWITAVGRHTGHDPSGPNRYYLWRRDAQGLRDFERKTRGNEAMHLVGILLPAAGLLLEAGDPIGRFPLLAVLIANVHPYLLQRYNRLRIVRILRRHPNGAPCHRQGPRSR